MENKTSKERLFTLIVKLSELDKKEYLKDYIYGLPREVAKESLSALEEILDELDCEDFFGAEGWRKFLNVQ
jgi:hypothetical protein